MLTFVTIRVCWPLLDSSPNKRGDSSTESQKEEERSQKKKEEEKEER